MFKVKTQAQLESILAAVPASVPLAIDPSDITENLTVPAVGAVLGVPLGIIMLQVVVDLFMGEDGDLVVRFRPMPYVYAILGTFVVSVLVNLFITLKVKKIDMVASLKANE